MLLTVLPACPYPPTAPRVASLQHLWWLGAVAGFNATWPLPVSFSCCFLPHPPFTSWIFTSIHCIVLQLPPLWTHFWSSLIFTPWLLLILAGPRYFNCDASCYFTQTCSRTTLHTVSVSHFSRGWTSSVHCVTLIIPQPLECSCSARTWSHSVCSSQFCCFLDPWWWTNYLTSTPVSLLLDEDINRASPISLRLTELIYVKCLEQYQVSI